MNKKGIIHRDLKLDSILIHNQKLFKVTNFGFTDDINRLKDPSEEDSFSMNKGFIN
jgi:serine/threonine protein kinase